MNRIKTAFVLLGITLVTGSTSRGQQDTASSVSGFVEALKDVSFESSFTSHPRNRFFSDRIEILDSKDKVTSTRTNIDIVEKGVIRINYSNGSTMWFVFSDEYDSYCVANIKAVYPFTIPVGGGAPSLDKWPDLSAESQAAITVQLDGHSDWSKLELKNGEIIPHRNDGGVEGSIEALRFNNYSIGALRKPKDLERGVSCLVLSRNGTSGWWLEGTHLGSGVAQFRNRDFTAFEKSPNKGFALRSPQFAYYLLKAGHHDQAFAQECYSEYYLGEFYDKTSEKFIHGLYEMGEMRRNSLVYDLAPYWYEKAAQLARTAFEDSPEKRAEYEIGLAIGFVRAGQYQSAIDTLQNMEKVPDFEAQFGLQEYNYLAAFSEGYFGLGQYDSAIAALEKSAHFSDENGHSNRKMVSDLNLVTCYVAKGEAHKAREALKACIKSQEDREAAKPDSKFETHELAIACVALEEWEAAIKFSTEANYKSGSYLFEEFPRLLAHWNSGDKEKAVEMGKKIRNRFDDLDDVRRSKDASEMFLATFDVMSDPYSQEKVNAFRKTWAVEKERLKKRPLPNYMLAFALSKVDRLLAP